MFVTDGNHRSTLAVTRALGHAGLAVAVGETRQPSLAGTSKFCQASYVYPSPLQNTEKFAMNLHDEIKRGGYRVLIPMTDVTARVVADMAEHLAPTTVPLPAAEKVQIAQDKKLVLCMAQKLGINCPATYVVSGGETIEDLSRRIEYPVVIKPRFSWYFRGSTWASGTVQYAHDAKELITKYHQMDAQIPGPLVQEMIRGEGRGVFLLLWGGELKAAFSHRRLREKPPSGGVSVLCESIELEDQILEQSVSLLKAIAWQGVAMVEFKMDHRDGRAKLMEINGRFWGSLQLAVDAGINFPLMLFRLAVGEKVAPEFSYRVGVKTRWLLGDLDHLLIRFKHRERGLPAEHLSRIRAFLDFFTFCQEDLHYEVLRLDDPGPGWYEAKNYIRELLGFEGVRNAL